ncbi:HdeD family acid-resistance protein [Rhodococcus sp. Q]|uniref:HdeD family acid-resistance protein n=1 Tax=Rhodococcus sp. Q TaxID=2502252 RepID=UPI0010F62FA7|nr:HdeD family acid-resistance protein [Rhodococcus sp. Q]
MTESPIVGTNEAILRIAKDVWWLLLIRGIIAVIFGIVALVWPDVTVKALIVVVGIFWIIDGIVSAVRAIQARKVVMSWVWWLAGALVSVIAGVVLFVWPDLTALAFAYLMGFWAILVGILEVIGSFQVMANGGQWIGSMVAGALALIFGLILVIWPGSGITGLMWLVGIFAIAFGVLFIVGAFQVRSAARRAGVV